MGQSALLFLLLVAVVVDAQYRSGGRRPICRAVGSVVTFVLRDDDEGEYEIRHQHENGTTDEEWEQRRSLLRMGTVVDRESRKKESDSVEELPLLLVEEDDPEWYETTTLRRTKDDVYEWTFPQNDAVRHLQEEAYEETLRECHCDAWWNRKHIDSIYCPMTTPFCGLMRRASNTTTASSWEDRDFELYCLRPSPYRNFSRNAMMIMNIWYALLLSFLVCTTPGRNCFGFVISKLCYCGSWCRNFNDRVAERLQTEKPEVARIMMRRNLYHVRRQNPQELLPEWLLDMQAVQALEPTPPIDAQRADEVNAEDKEARPTSLRLKTRIFYADDDLAGKSVASVVSGGAESVAGADEEYRHVCIICFQPLQDGDKVGVLPCGHCSFHSDCVKQWLARQNVCPLCKTPDVAKPQYDNEQQQQVPSTVNSAAHESDESDPAAESDTHSEHDDDAGDDSTPASSAVDQQQQRHSFVPSPSNPGFQSADA